MVGGLVWGVGAVYLVTPDSTEQLIVMLVISATASGAVPAFGSYRPATFAYIVTAMLPFVLWSAARGGALHQALTLMGVVFTGAFLMLGWRFNATLIASLLLRFENLDLAEDLRRQKESAEQANVAKSRFLAAASHDLRQPVHALGMFVSHQPSSAAFIGRAKHQRDRQHTERDQRRVRPELGAREQQTCAEIGCGNAARARRALRQQRSLHAAAKDHFFSDRPESKVGEVVPRVTARKPVTRRCHDPRDGRGDQRAAEPEHGVARIRPVIGSLHRVDCRLRRASTATPAVFATITRCRRMPPGT